MGLITQRKKELEKGIYETNPSLQYTDTIFLLILCLVFVGSIMLFEHWMRWVWGISAILCFVSMIGALNK